MARGAKPDFLADCWIAAVGRFGLSPRDFWRITPRDLLLLAGGAQRRQDAADVFANLERLGARVKQHG